MTDARTTRPCRKCGVDTFHIVGDTHVVLLDAEPLNVCDPYPKETWTLYTSTPYGWHMGPTAHAGQPIFRTHQCADADPGHKS